MSRTVAPFFPAIPVPGSKLLEAKRRLRMGVSLKEAAEAVGLSPAVLDQELWRTLGYTGRRAR
jgi:hypothetical protein